MFFFLQSLKISENIFESGDPFSNAGHHLEYLKKSLLQVQVKATYHSINQTNSIRGINNVSKKRHDIYNMNANKNIPPIYLRFFLCLKTLFSQHIHIPYSLYHNWQTYFHKAMHGTWRRRQGHP